MNRALILCTAAIAAWCSPGFAARQVLVVDGPIDADGILSGVDLVGNVTLNVGTLGGAQTDIMNSNNPYVAGFIAVSTAASSQGNIAFNSSSTVYGDIGVTQPGGPFLLDIFAGNSDSTVNFMGSVYSTTLNVLGTGSINFNSGTTNITATNFAGDGIITLAPNTTLIGAMTTNTANTGTLNLGGGSQVTGAVGGATGLKAINVLGGDNIAGVSATIDGAVEAYSFSLGTNTLNVTGALKIDNPGPYSINTTLASQTLYGHIVPVGFTTLPSTLGINVLVPSTSYLPVGSQFNIVQAISGTSGSLVSVTIQNPTNPLYTFSAVPLAGTLDGLVTIQTDTIPLQASSNPVVPVLIDIPSPSADLIEVLTAINALTDPAAVNNATAQLNPSASALAAPLVGFQGTRHFQDLWVSRMDTVLCSDVSKADKNNSVCQSGEPKSGWWLKGFGSYGDQKSQGDFAGYNSRMLGAMLAYDVPVAANLPGKTRAGLGVGYARSNIDGKIYDASTNFDTYQTTAYVGHERGPWFVYGDASFGWNEYSGTRNINFPGISRSAQSDYSGQDYTLFANTGYHISAHEFTFTPLASLQYTRMNLGGYTETGAGDISLKVKSSNYNFVESGLGVKVERSFNYRDQAYVPQVHFKWLHALANPALKNTAEFTAPGSSSFATNGHKAADDTFNVGGGLTLLSCECSAKTWALEAVYDYDWRTDKYSAHQGMIKFSGHF